MSLDLNQIEAVKFANGPALVIAGPGSGKTTVLANRVRYLIKELQVPPEKILVITFTRAAAGQMNKRFNDLFEGYAPVNFTTFHSLFYSIICEHFSSNVSLISPKEKLNILKMVVMKEKQDFSDSKINDLLNEFSYYKNNGIKVGKRLSEVVDNDSFFDLFDAYQDEIFNIAKPDYDDFTIWCRRIFDENEKLLKEWQNKYLYCLIDEFQDINEIQYSLIKKMIITNNIYAVGDDDQAIYGFRGANPEICFEFVKEYNAKKLYLQTNYRCNKEIVKVSSKLISHNVKRFDKNIKAYQEDSGQGVFINKYEDFSTQYHDICKSIVESKSKSAAILLRTNSIPVRLIGILKDGKINISYKEKIENIAFDATVVDILTYIKLAKGERTYKNLLMIANKPSRYISRQFVLECKNDELIIDNDDIFTFATLYRKAKEYNYLQKNIYKLEINLNKMKNMDAFESIIYILEVIGYNSYLNDKNIKAKEVLCKLKEIAKEYKNTDEFIAYFDTLTELKEDTKIINNNDNRKIVEIMTIHSAKGLEWDEVYIPDVNEKNIPHGKALDMYSLEEERRLFYVALTRARNKLFVGCVNNEDERVKPSFFVEELT